MSMLYFSLLRAGRYGRLSRTLLAVLTVAVVAVGSAVVPLGTSRAASAAATPGALPENCLDPDEVPTIEDQAYPDVDSLSVNAGMVVADTVTSILYTLISQELAKEDKVREAVDRTAYCFPGYNVVIAQPHDGSTQHMTGAIFVSTADISGSTFRVYVFRSGVFYQAGDLGYKNWGYAGYFTKSDDGRTVTFSRPPDPERKTSFDGASECEVTNRSLPSRPTYYGMFDLFHTDQQGRHVRMLVDDLRACYPDYNIMVMHAEQPYEWTSPPDGLVRASDYTMQDIVDAGESTKVGDWGPGLGGRGHYDAFVFKSGTFHNKGDGGYFNWGFYGNFTRSADGMTVTFSQPSQSDLSYDPMGGSADVDFNSDTPQYTSGTYPGCDYSGAVPSDKGQLIQSLISEYQRCFPNTNILAVANTDKFSFGYLSNLKHLADVNGITVYSLDVGVVSNRGDGGWQNWGFSGLFDRVDTSDVVFNRGNGGGSLPGGGSTQGDGNGGVGNPMEDQPGGDDGGTRPPVVGDCRPDGLVPTAGVSVPYCDVYQSDGREWLGQGRPRRVVAYFNGSRTGADGSPHYLVNNIPWSQVTHVNYAFATVVDNRIAVDGSATQMQWPNVAGAQMDTSLPYRGAFNLLTRYKRLHPRVKTLISVGGWAGSTGFYPMTTNSDGSVNQNGIDTFAASVVNFLRTYGFNGVDIDFEYPTALDDSGNPNDWSLANARRKGLPDAYTALMKTLRENLDRASAADRKYYMLTSASSASGYLVRGMASQNGLKYQDFTNLMSYDFHGTWNDVVGPNAPLYDDHKDPELSDQYTTPEYGGIGYFNVAWAMKYLRGQLQAGRINIGVPYYTRGWKNVTGGTDGMWGTSSKTGCEPGTGIKRPCGDGAIGIDNVWHDTTSSGGELGSGTNPLWHAENLERNILPNYAPNVGLTPGTDANDRLSGTYTRFWDDTTKTSWLWNADKKVFLSTEDEAGIDAVAALVRSTGAGGVMVWELAGDYQCPATVDADHPCGMGYTLTTRLNAAMGNAGAYDASRNTGSTARVSTQTANLSVDFVNFPTETAKLWPLTPTVRLTNNTGRTLGGGKDTTISFDIPASTSPLVKDVNWQTGDQGGQWKITAGSTFDRITTTLDYCQIIPPGKTLDMPIIYYLPVTGPVNTVFSVSGTSFAPITEYGKGQSAGTPPAGGCNAPNWDSTKIYNPSTQSVEATTVKYNGKVWKAKWWTQNNIPGTGVDSDHEPWKLIGPAS